MTEQSLSPNAQLAVRAIGICSDRDYANLHTVFTEDVVLDFPFWPRERRSWTGLDEMIRKFSIEKVFTTFRIDVVDVFDAGDTVIVEGKSEGIYPSDREPYRNHYLFVMTCRDGKITRLREFFNPLEALKQGPEEPKAQ